MHTLNQITEVAQELFKSREIEMNVLEAILTDRIDLDQVKPAYFADKDTSTLARTIFKLKDKGIKPDYSTICNQLKIDGVRINGSSLAEMLGEIVGNPFPVKVESNLKLLVEMYKRRESFKSAKEYLTILTESDESLELLNTAFASKIDKITLDDSTTDDALDGVIERLNKDLHSAYDLEERNRYKYGISKLDEFTAGLHPSELTTVAAKSGIGKSAFALQVSINLLTNGLRVLIISREMSDVQIMKRMLANMTRIDGSKFRSRQFTSKEWEIVDLKIEDVAERFKDKLFINTQISTTAGIKKRIREIKPDVVIIDYLQLLSPIKSESSREREVASMSREIKAMTSDFEIPIIILSQLNDEYGDYRPKGERAIRESKAVYMNSNNVIYIHEPRTQYKEDNWDPGELKGYVREGKINQITYNGIIRIGNRVLEIILDKQRDGANVRFIQEFESRSMRFNEIPKPLSIEDSTELDEK